MTSNQSMGNIRALNEPAVLSYGGKAVGLTFNPSGSALVYKLKAHYAEIIDIMDALRTEAQNTPGPSNAMEKARLCSIAITEAQGAQMWAVKAATWDI